MEGRLLISDQVLMRKAQAAMSAWYVPVQPFGNAAIPAPSARANTSQGETPTSGDY